jgi:hypothetical protein
MEGSIWRGPPVRQATCHKSQVQQSHRSAVARAMTGARLLLGMPVQPSSPTCAAELVGSSFQYVEAAKWLLEAQDQALLTDVLAGHKPLLEAGAQARVRADLIGAYRRATLADRAAFGSIVGIDDVFDSCIVPSL